MFRRSWAQVQLWAIIYFVLCNKNAIIQLRTFLIIFNLFPKSSTQVSISVVIVVSVVVKFTGLIKLLSIYHFHPCTLCQSTRCSNDWGNLVIFSVPQFPCKTHQEIFTLSSLQMENSLKKEKVWRECQKIKIAWHILVHLLNSNKGSCSRSTGSLLYKALFTLHICRSRYVSSYRWSVIVCHSSIDIPMNLLKCQWEADSVDCNANDNAWVPTFPDWQNSMIFSGFPQVFPNNK